jgi:hypothetical protein
MVDLAGKALGKATRLHILPLALIAALLTPAFAQTYTFTVLNRPNFIPRGINNNNQVVGSVGAASSVHPSVH